VIAGRTRFYVVAGILGAIAGEALAGVFAIGAARLLFRSAALMSLVVLLVSSTAGGAYAGVMLMRWWYRREAESTGIVVDGIGLVDTVEDTSRTATPRSNEAPPRRPGLTGRAS
jgi:hypothetical protein